MNRQPQTDHPVHELVASRWSPYSYADRPVTREDLRSLLEAARWAASSYNEQPWHYLLASREEPAEFERMLSCLVEPNQAWAKQAGALLISVARLNFVRNNKPNAAAWHDLGLAAGNLSLEATARGLCVHQMIGILPDRARELYGIPEGHEAATALAIGYAAEGEGHERDQAPRSRKPLAEFVFEGSWQGAANWLQDLDSHP